MERIRGYRDLEFIGQGTFAVVYQVVQERFDRAVALKVLSLDRMAAQTFQRFQLECQLVGKLTGHPNVVTVFDSGLTGSGRPYLAMAYYERGSLKDQLDRDGVFPVGEVLRIGVKIAGALAAAHDAGIVHGDVKPQNILISRFNEPALADFGIAQLIEVAGVALPSDSFTLHHAAPEVVEGHAVSIASDVYSLGSTLYQLLAGRPAFWRGVERSVDARLRILREDPPDIVRPDLPPTVMTTILGAMARRPGQRPESARALAASLQQLQIESGASATEIPEVSDSGSAEDRTEPRKPASEAGMTLPDQPTLHSEQPQVKEPARRWPLRLLAAGLVVAIGIGIGAGIRFFHTGLTTPPPAASRQTATPAVVAPAVLATARPTALTVTDGGASVALRWQLGGSDRLPLVLEQSSASATQPTLTPVQNGATATTVSGLDSKQGYCFRVGAIVALGQPSAVAWSSPVCIRSATTPSSP